MAVFTKLSDNEIASIIGKYEIGTLVEATEITEGIENTNYLIKTSKGKFVLTIFEKRVSRKDIPFYISFMEYLKAADLPVPEVMTNRNDNKSFTFNAKTGIIISFLEGKSVDRHVTSENCKVFGEFLAKTHNISMGFNKKRVNEYDKKGCRRLLQNLIIRRGISDEDKSLVQKILNEELSEFYKEMPKAVIHGDFFMDNVFFIDNKITGIIDFYFASYDFLIYDLAIAINAWCFDNNIRFNKERALALINGYNSVRKLTLAERALFRDFCLLAAVRFFITRSLDKVQGSPDSKLVKLKNPDDFRFRMKFFLSWKGIKP